MGFVNVQKNVTFALYSERKMLKTADQVFNLYLFFLTENCLRKLRKLHSTVTSFIKIGS